jgi:hypothetical protein
MQYNHHGERAIASLNTDKPIGAAPGGHLLLGGEGAFGQKSL